MTSSSNGALKAAELHNRPSLCDKCKPWADEVTGGNAYLQARLALFVQKHLHRQTHFELHTAWMHHRGYWPDLMAWLGLKVSEA